MNGTKGCLEIQVKLSRSCNGYLLQLATESIVKSKLWFTAEQRASNWFVAVNVSSKCKTP